MSASCLLISDYLSKLFRALPAAGGAGVRAAEGAENRWEPASDSARGPPLHSAEGACTVGSRMSPRTVTHCIVIGRVVRWLVIRVGDMYH